jgi:hypothetical protein
MRYAKPFISINKVSVFLGVHHSTAQQYLESLGLEIFVIGRRRLYRTEDVLPRLEGLLSGHLNNFG